MLYKIPGLIIAFVGFTIARSRIKSKSVERRKQAQKAKRTDKWVK